MKSIKFVAHLGFIIFLISCDSDLSVRDLEGHKYKTIKIGNTEWFAENLQTAFFQNGDSIPNILEDLLWYILNTPGFCYYDNNPNNKNTFGNLYNWYAVNDKRKICPCGWEVATKSHFGELSRLFGGDQVSGKSLKDNSNRLWLGDTNATNDSGFSALPGGHRDEHFERSGKYAFFWQKDDYHGQACFNENLCAYECSILSDFSYVNQDFGHKYRGMSVRCVKIEKSMK